MEQVAGEPAGGYCRVPVMGILRAWWALRGKIIGRADFGVWLASFEVVARRCRLRRGRRVRYRVEELSQLTGESPERCARSVARLGRAGLLEWSDRRVAPLDGSSLEARAGREDIERLRDLVRNHRRAVPVPRRLLRFMCRCRRRVLLATLLGHLLRCVYRRERACRADGLCKASWVSAVFGVDERNVKRARRELVERGILATGTAPQWVLNRHGLPVVVNLDWLAADHGETSPPRSPQRAPESPPPRKTENSASRLKDQERAATRAGSCDTGSREPSLRAVRDRDLVAAGSLDALWRQARAAGYVDGSEASRLLIFGAAAHARRVATRNAAGLFAAVVRRGLWTYISQEDEDVGRRMASSAVSVDDHANAAWSAETLGISPASGPCDLKALLARCVRSVGCPA